MLGINNNGDIISFNGANATDSFNFKAKVTGQTNDEGKNGVEIFVRLKYLSQFWRIIEMPFIDCEVNFNLSWSENCFIVYPDVANQGTTFKIRNAKLYVPVFTLSTQDNANLLPQLRSCFKRTINWNKYLAKPELLQ